MEDRYGRSSYCDWLPALPPLEARLQVYYLGQLLPPLMELFIVIQIVGLHIINQQYFLPISGLSVSDYTTDMVAQVQLYRKRSHN